MDRVDKMGSRYLSDCLFGLPRNHVYRVFTEIQVPEGQSIWAPGNSLSDIWINTNTIGSSLMTLALLISGFASSFERWYVRIIGAVAVVAAFLGIWVCQSRGALVALIVLRYWIFYLNR